MTRNRGTLLVVSARLDDTRKAVAEGRWPRKDYFEMAARLDAKMIGWDTVAESRAARKLARVAGVSVALAWLAYRRRDGYERIYTDGEHIAIPLALMLRFSRWRPWHTTIGHLVSTRSKRATFRWLRPQKAIDRVLLHATNQQRIARDELGLGVAQTPLTPFGIDMDFWSPDAVPAPDAAEPALICTAGLEYRDYQTLLAAAPDVPARIVIAAGSRWSRHEDATRTAELPPNAAVTTLDYRELRLLYARARLVVVPLQETPNQAGITTILEAMAMGKPVIVTATTGQRDVVRGRLCTAAGVTETILGDPGVFGVGGPLATEETGLYVPTGDPAALARAVRYLLDQPELAARMGAAGRRLVTRHMSLECFVANMCRALTDGSGTRRVRTANRGRLTSPRPVGAARRGE
jgi:glycosyltransferase involved in cell wall biosynthesis